LDIIHGLLDFQSEAAVIAKVEDNPDVRFIPFSHEELVLILPFDHLRARKDALQFKEMILRREN
jgi:hypothetical protein